jgi:hypothetical protein
MYAQIKPVPATNVEVSTRLVDPFQAAIADSESSLTDLMKWIDEWEKELNAGIPLPVEMSNLNQSKSNINRQAGTPVSISRSNIKNVAMKLDNLSSNNPKKRNIRIADVHEALADLELPMQELYNSILSKGEGYFAKAAELKTKHDTVKNSIGNIR